LIHKIIDIARKNKYSNPISDIVLKSLQQIKIGITKNKAIYKHSINLDNFFLFKKKKASETA